MVVSPNPTKSLINLTLGDPTRFENFQPYQEVIKPVLNTLRGNNSGYAPSFGHPIAREAVAKYVSKPGAPVNPEDVFMTCGCSEAVSLSITVLVNPGENILVPSPGFPLYETLALSEGIEVKRYNCVPESSWELDLGHMESLLDSKTKLIVVVNPSNPCGSNFSKVHIKAILEVAERKKVPILADEIYADMVFKGESFFSFASQTKIVPILSCGGIGKRFLVPGWRVGWIVVHDRNNIFGEDIRSGLKKLTQRTLGPTTFIQVALPDIFSIPQTLHDETLKRIEDIGMYIFDRLGKIPGLRPVKPQAAMYMMVGYDKRHLLDFEDDKMFTERLISEQSVFCLSGQFFGYPGYFRLVITVSEEQAKEACERIEEFCRKYYKP